MQIPGGRGNNSQSKNHYQSALILANTLFGSVLSLNCCYFSDFFGPVKAKTVAISEIFGAVEAKTAAISLILGLV